MIEAVEQFRPALKTPLPGCDRRCQPILVYSDRTGGRHWMDRHDPSPHEAYGATLADPPAIWPSVVRTGPLTVDGTRSIAIVDGQEILLTPRECQILRCLGARLGEPVTFRTLLIEVWGDEGALLRQRAGNDGAHLPRVFVARLRHKLGRAARLLVSRPHIGFELLAEESAS